jgi:hypothetical protein
LLDRGERTHFEKAVELQGGETTLLCIDVPKVDTLQDLFAFSRRLTELPETDHYEFDFSGVDFASPAWMILVGNALRRFRSARPAARRTAREYRHLDYAAHAGFFRYFGIKFGRPTGLVATTERFVPLTERATSDIEAKAIAGFRHHGDVIQEEADQLAYVLTQSQAGPVVDTLAYSIREIVRNVVEHSGASHYTFAAQYWPGRHTAEIVVSDPGIGLVASLSSRHQIDDESAAIRLAIAPGISSKAPRRSSAYDHWANSGYGLFMTQQLCSSGGFFGLASGSKAHIWTTREETVIDTDIAGTTVVMQLNTDALGALNDRLRDLREKARHLKFAHAVQPSHASLSARKPKAPYLDS